MGRATLDPDAPPRFTDAELARLDAMTPDDIEANARADLDNPPLTPDELVRLRALTGAGRQKRGPDGHPHEEDFNQAGGHAQGRRLAGTIG